MRHTFTNLSASLLQRPTFRRIALMAAALFMLPIIGFSATAGASQPYDGCPSARFCAWSDVGYNGIMWSWAASLHGTCVNLNSTQAGKISSFYNRQSYAVNLFEYSNCATYAPGDTLQVLPGVHASEDDGTGKFPWYMNDSFVSIRF